MKTRLGFVSNSSSSSFCLYGIHLSYNTKLTEEDYSFLQKHGLEHMEDDGDMIYIGREWKTVRDGETGGQFKESVEEAVAKRWPDKTCYTHEEAWYNG